MKNRTTPATHPLAVGRLRGAGAQRTRHAARSTCSLLTSMACVWGVAACSDGWGDGRTFIEPADTSVEHEELDEQEQFLSTLSERALYCGNAGDIMASGERLMFDEVYDVQALEEELAEDPELRERYGSDLVETCDQARALGRMKLEIQEAGYTSESSGSTGQELGQLRQGIWRGTNATNQAVLAIFTSSSFCSATAISPTHILTASHCLPLNNTNCGPGVNCSSEIITIRKATTAGNFVDVQTGALLYRNDNYTGYGDSGDDIGLISTSSSWNQPTADCRPLWIANPTSGATRHVFAAWGSTTQFPPSNYGIQNQPPSDKSFGIDFVASGSTYFFDDNDNDVNHCTGDSGSPAFALVNGGHFIQGVLSEGEHVEGRICTIDSGHKQRWTTVGPKMAWLEARLGFSCTRTQSGQAASCF